jgi:hypothetical protein
VAELVCEQCGAEDVVARKLCRSCYNRWSESKQKEGTISRLSGEGVDIDRERLHGMYWTDGQSLAMIARELGCTRQYVHQLMKEYGIPRRTKRRARRQALKGGRITHKRADGSSSTLQAVDVDPYFFRKWSEEMAWVLGLIATDGSIHDKGGTSTVSRLTFGQRDRVNVEKVLEAMKAEARIEHRPQSGTSGQLYYFRVSTPEIISDLAELGITPRKSMTIKCPPVPRSYFRHFLRGVWDGDGTVSNVPGGAQPTARLVSGSISFVSTIKERLEDQYGFPQLRLSREKYFTLCLGSYETAALAHVLYSGISEACAYSSKRARFLACIPWLERRLATPNLHTRRARPWLLPIRDLFPLKH